jgi:hypothetical protein
LDRVVIRMMRPILFGQRTLAGETDATSGDGIVSQGASMPSTEEQPGSWKWFEIGLVVLVLLLHLYPTLSPPASLMNWYTNDDAFYYFKVAENITAGHGITLDGINVTNGFHPLWMLICVAIFWLAKYDLLLPLRLLVMVSALCSAGTGVLLFRLLRKFTSAETGMLVAAIWVFLPYISIQVFQGGLESPISAFLLTWLVYLLVHHSEKGLSFWNWAIIGLAAALTVLARLDNIFVVLLLGVWFVLRFTTPFLRTIAIGDLASIYILGLLSFFVCLRAGWCTLEDAGHALWLIGAGLLVIPLVFLLFGMYSYEGEPATWRFFGRSLASTVVAVAAITLILLAVATGVTGQAFPFAPVFLFSAGLLLTTPAIRLGARALFNADRSPLTGTPPIRSRAFWRIVSSRATAYYLPVIVLVGAYLTFNLLYAGTAMPVSGQIKQWWGVLYADLYGSVMNRGLSEVMGNDAWGLAMLPLRSMQAAISTHFDYQAVPILVKTAAAAGVVALLVAQGRWVVRLLDQLVLFALFVGLYAQILTYTATAYWHPRGWYWASEMVFVALFAGILLECLRRALQPLPQAQKRWGILMAILAGACALSFAQMLWHRFPYQIPGGDRNSYLDVIRALEAQTEPGSLIGMPGGGTTAYFIQDRTIVNLDGLINSHDYFESLRTARGNQFLDEMGLDYVLAAEAWSHQKPYNRVFSGRLVPVREVAGAYLFRYLKRQP